MFTKEDLSILEKQEELLRYDSFSSCDALELGNAIARAALKYDRGISIQVVRQKDQLVIFQYVMDDKAERNLRFAEGKGLSVLNSGHSSAWTYVASSLHLYKAKDGELCSGGSFPIRLKNGTLAAIVMVSGLHEGKDHQVILDGLTKTLDVSVPQLTKQIA